ncbi:MAG TPA: hypothetical protein VFI02_12570 [Armatimonadota bacterium]|nr:hypothetical protein [Armatimonadota bacterium]
MNRFVFRVYFEYNGPSHADPFRSQKEPHEIAEALRHFPNELPHYLADLDATVTDDPAKQDSNSIIVTVLTTLNEAELYEPLKRCLNGLDLFATKLEQTTVAVHPQAT